MTSRWRLIKKNPTKATMTSASRSPSTHRPLGIEGALVAGDRPAKRAGRIRPVRV